MADYAVDAVFITQPAPVTARTVCVRPSPNCSTTCRQPNGTCPLNESRGSLGGRRRRRGLATRFTPHPVLTRVVRPRCQDTVIPGRPELGCRTKAPRPGWPRPGGVRSHSTSLSEQTGRDKYLAAPVTVLRRGCRIPRKRVDLRTRCGPLDLRLAAIGRRPAACSDVIWATKLGTKRTSPPDPRSGEISATGHPAE